ncbi:MAG: alpha/beta hydrolase [Oligoflexia bacterium]|nr:alpha/beta hydrolase [Oligoflexia bacterium]
MSEYTFKYQDCLGQNIGYIDNEVVSQKVILFFHGFPEGAMTWSRYLDYYRSKGVRAIAIELKGYHNSFCPADDEREFRIDLIAQELVSFVEQLELKNIHLVGHDWGAIVVWYLATYHSQYFKDAITLNAPHWHVFKDALFGDPLQIMKSWYIYFIQLKGVSEALIKFNDYQVLRRSLIGGSRGKLPIGLVNRYKESWPQCLSSMLAWYRAMKYIGLDGRAEKVKIPMTLLMGKKDPFIRPKLAEKCMKYCEESRFHIVDDCAHFIHHENEHLLQEFIDQAV